MIDILGLLKKLEFADNGRYCKICGSMTHKGYNGGPCELKAAIDALEAGRLVVEEKPA